MRGVTGRKDTNSELRIAEAWPQDCRATEPPGPHP